MHHLTVSPPAPVDAPLLRSPLASVHGVSLDPLLQPCPQTAPHGSLPVAKKAVHLSFKKVKMGQPVYVLGGDVTIDIATALSQ